MYQGTDAETTYPLHPGVQQGAEGAVGMVAGRQRSRHQAEDRASRSSRRGIPGLASVVTARTHALSLRPE